MADYRTEAISELLQVVNPAYRRLDGQVRSLTGKLGRRHANFGAIALQEPIEPQPVAAFLRRKAALQEEIEDLERELAARKTERKATPQHIPIDELPEEARFRQLSTQSKHLVDTLKMIAYRAETAMANSLREHLARPNEARCLLRALYTTDADLLPDPAAGTLTVQLHHGANAANDLAIATLCEEAHRDGNGFPPDEFAPGAEIGLSVDSSKSGHLNVECCPGILRQHISSDHTPRPRRMPGGRVVWDGVQTDVTERRQIQEVLREAGRRKQELLATLAHELRNPLAPLKTGLELLRLRGADPEICGRARHDGALARSSPRQSGEPRKAES